MELETKKLLLDVLTSCEAIQEFTDGKSFSDYEQSRLLRSATEREFEVIGEALGKLMRKSPHKSLRWMQSSPFAIASFMDTILWTT